MKISRLEASGSPEPGEASRGREGGPGWPRLTACLRPAGPDLLAGELQHRLRIEAAVAAGAKNVVKLLSGPRMRDRKALAEVGLCPPAHCLLHSSARPPPTCSGAAPRAGCLWRKQWRCTGCGLTHLPRPSCLCLLCRPRPSSRNPPRSWTSYGWPWNYCWRSCLPPTLCAAG